MVRINLLNPHQLSDQHLIAEYNEMLMLVAYIKKYPSLDSLPQHFTLNKGHMRFFKDKVLYLSKRHKQLKTEMRRRGFHTNKSILLSDFGPAQVHDWTPAQKDRDIIIERISQKLLIKPHFYRYYGEYKSVEFFLILLHQ